MKQLILSLLALFLFATLQSCSLRFTKNEKSEADMDLLQKVERTTPQRYREVKHSIELQNGYDDEIIRVPSEHLWNEFGELIALPPFFSKVPSYAVFAMALFGLFLMLTRSRNYIVAVCVIVMGLCELYHFLAYEGNPTWFYSPLLSFWWRMLTLVIVSTTLFIQLLLTDRLSIPDSIQGNVRKEWDKFDNGFLFITLMSFSAVITFVTGKIFSWRVVTTIFNYITLAFILAVIIEETYKSRGRMLKILIPLIISFGGIAITMTYCPWTGLILVVLAYTTNEYKEQQAKIATLTRLSESGDSDAMVKLGTKIKKGEVAGKKDEDAVALFRKAMLMGNARAYDSLADCYLIGKGVPVDGRKAFELAMKSYNMGNKKACSTLSVYYRTQFTPPDHVNAHKWDMIGAQEGYALCQLRVGIDYKNGDGVVKNEAEAYRWIKMVADGNSKDKDSRGYACYLCGKYLASHGNISQARYYMQKAQDLGNNLAKKYGNI